MQRGASFIWMRVHWSVTFTGFELCSTRRLPPPRLGEAVSLWKGGFLKGFSISSSPDFSDWQLFEEQSLFYSYRQLLRTLYEEDISRGELLQALLHTRAALILDPFDEQTHRALIRIHAISGERSLALEQYERCRALIAKEFDSAPEQETIDLIEQVRHGSLRRERVRRPHLRMTLPRVAILPFRMLTVCDDERQLLIDLVLEGLEDFFVLSGQLMTISRSSCTAYANRFVTISKIAEELRLDYLVEGFIMSEKESLTLEARLIEARGESVAAIERIRLSDHESDPVRISETIGKSLLADLSGANGSLQGAGKREQTSTERESINARLRLQARYLLRVDQPSSTLHALKLYREAVRLDPEDAEAWAGIGYALLTECEKGICWPNRVDLLPEIQRAAEKALSLDPVEPLALNILGNVAIARNWDFERAEMYYRRSRQMSPNHPKTLRDYTELCIMTGRFTEARSLTERVDELDPVHHHSLKLRFWLHLASGELETATRIIRQQFLIYPAPELERIMTSYLQLIAGDVKGAIESVESVDTDGLSIGWENSLLAAAGYAYGAGGYSQKALAVIARLEQNLEEPISPRLPIALSCIGMGHVDKALSWIGQAVKEHDPALFFFAVNPLFSPLSRMPEAQELLRPTNIVLIG